MNLINHINLVDIRLIICIAETQSLSKGAERVSLSTASASKRIKNLEQKLGVDLLVRTPKGMMLTPAGKAYFHHARLVRQQLERMSGDLEQYILGTDGHIRLHANSTAITEFLSEILPHFLQEFPGVHIDLSEKMSIDIPGAILSGEAEIGIMAGRPDDKELDVIPYREERLVAVVPSSHSLAKGSIINFKHLLEYDHVSLPDNTALTGFLSREAEKLRKPLKVRIQVTNCDSVCRMVEADAGVAVIPESAAQRHRINLNIKSLSLCDDWAVRRLFIVMRDRRQLPAHSQKLLERLVADSLSNLSHWNENPE